MIGHLWTLAGFSALSLGRREIARHAAGEAERHLAAWTGWRTDQLTELDARLDATRAPTEPGELTGREQEVADLVAEGLSNGEIAKRLFISPKTASVHVSNILAKLRLSNRTEIAAWVLQRRAD